MEVTFIHHREADIAGIRLLAEGAVCHMALADDIQATVDTQRPRPFPLDPGVHSVPRLRAAPRHRQGDGTQSLAQFQVDVAQGRQRRRVALNPKPLSRRALATASAASPTYRHTYRQSGVAQEITPRAPSLHHLTFDLRGPIFRQFAVARGRHEPG